MDSLLGWSPVGPLLTIQNGSDLFGIAFHAGVSLEAGVWRCDIIVVAACTVVLGIRAGSVDADQDQRRAADIPGEVDGRLRAAAVVGKDVCLGDLVPVKISRCIQAYDVQEGMASDLWR